MTNSQLKKLIIIGAGGNAEVIYSTIEDINQDKKTFEVIGYLDDNEKEKSQNIVGKVTKKNIEKYIMFNDVFFVWTLRSTNLREDIYDKFLKLEIPRTKFTNIIHKKSSISKSSSLGLGITIHPFVSIGPKTKIGDHVNIFSNSTIGHDTKLDEFSYVANNSSIGAYVQVKRGGYIGMNSTIKERIQIKEWTIVGMSSVVLKDTEKKSIVVGNPAKKLNKL